MRIHPVLKGLLLIVSIGVLAAGQARADELYGRIRGTVTDPSGAAIPGARVTVRNTATGLSRSMTTSEAGAFEFINLLAPGVYDLNVQKEGFREFHASNISLNLNQVYVANATLEVGSTRQVVTVEEIAAQINTTEMQLGATVTGSTIVDMPLVDRNWIELQQLEPGVMGASDRFGNGSNGAAKTNFATNGAETQQNSFYVSLLSSCPLLR